MNFFNARELAIGFWIIVSLILASLNKSLRKNIRDLLKITFSKHFLVIYLLVLVYISFWVYAFYSWRIWDTTLLKSTILWLFLVASITLYKISEVVENKKYFYEAIKNTLKLNILVEFIIGLYSLNIWLELLIIPSVFMVSILFVYIPEIEKYKNTKRLFSQMLNLIGLFLLLYSICQITIHFKDIATIQTLKEYLISPVLSILFLPFIYGLSLYMNYHTCFILVRKAIASPEIQRYAKKNAIFYFNFNIDSLNRWKSRLFIFKINSKQDVIESIKLIQEIKTIEKKPPFISIDQGWSAYKAKDFLKDYGISTNHYNYHGDNDWSACSNYIEMDDELLPNYISYYVIGEKFIAKELKLVVDVYTMTNVFFVHQKLLQLSQVLYWLSFKNEMPKIIEKAVIEGNEASVRQEYAFIKVHKVGWKNRINGYSFKFSIKHITAC